MGRVVFVRRSVLLAAERLEALSDGGEEANPLDLAEHKIEDCRAAGDAEGMKFWRCVWTHIMRSRQDTLCLQIVDDDGQHRHPVKQRPEFQQNSAQY